MNKVVVESRLNGDTTTNLRFVLWCCRALLVREGKHAIASHMICPWFMDDSNSNERDQGIAWEWVWEPYVPHMFFCDLGWSRGMLAARDKCMKEQIPYDELTLAKYDPDMWEFFLQQHWPPHTVGFQLEEQ